MQPENPEERAIVGELEKSGWSVIAFTARYRYFLLGSRQGANPERKKLLTARANGPVAIAGSTDREFVNGAIYQELNAGAKLALDSGKDNYRFNYGDWSMISRRVIATKDCVGCHEDLDHKPIKVGQTIGIYILGFRKNTR
jgi:hypothetical protein